MKKSIIFATLISSVGIMAQNKITYPKTKKIDHKDVYFNTEVSDFALEIRVDAPS